MQNIVRFGVSLDRGLLERFDVHIREKKVPTRSKAIEGLIRDHLVAERWETGSGAVAGAITIVYDHHRREMVNTLLQLQHDHQESIVSVQHVHLTHDHCLEVVIVRGQAPDVRRLHEAIKAVKGVQHAYLTMAAAS